MKEIKKEIKIVLFVFMIYILTTLGIIFFVALILYALSLSL
jgi:hypothetical protein